MRKQLALTALLAAATALPAHAQSQSALERIRADLSELSQRVGKVEAENQQLKQENAELKTKNDKLEATTDYLRTEASATRKGMAEEAPKIEKIGGMEKSMKSADWASKISWKGDMRYRHENIDPEEAADDQTRHRVRARFGMTAKVNDTIKATVALATSGGNNDPRSTNQTLGSGFERKGVAIDMAYADWQPLSGLNVQLGKMPQPWQKVGSFFWDGDITPEGVAVKYSGGALFASAFGYWLSERSTAADATLLGGQLGFKADMGGMKLTGAVGYYDVGSVEAQIVTAATSCTLNTVFFGGAQGNTTVTSGGCTRLANDFNLIEALAQAEMKVGGWPLTLFANYIQNQEADALDTGHSFGITLGKAGDPGTWDFGYVYQSMEKDAQFAQFVDSDFGGGITDTQGSVVKIGYAPAKNWTLNGTYFMNDRFVDVGTQRDYKRLQLDANFKF